jgi:putative FmdB family regulatory protein
VPTYEYACTQCGQHVEVFQRLSEEPLTTCGVCGGQLRKVFHPAGILFKGSGFYSTDNRSSSKPAKVGSKGEPSSSSPPSSPSSSSSPSPDPRASTSTEEKTA